MFIQYMSRPCPVESVLSPTPHPLYRTAQAYRAVIGPQVALVPTGVSMVTRVHLTGSSLNLSSKADGFWCKDRLALTAAAVRNFEFQDPCLFSAFLISDQS